MKINKIKRSYFGLYLTQEQIDLIKNWIEYNQSKGISKYTSDYIIDVFTDSVKNDEEFNKYLISK